jgi:hypothetical protein
LTHQKQEKVKTTIHQQTSKPTNLKSEGIMKTLKSALVAVLVVCTMAGVASANTNTDGFHKKPAVINITIEKAVHDPGILMAMVRQLNVSMLGGGNNQALYYANVTYSGRVFRISGTFEQWKLFFLNSSKLVIDKKPQFKSAD